MIYRPYLSCQLVREGRLPLSDPLMTNPGQAAAVLWECLHDADREQFLVLLINTRNRLIGVNVVSVGTANEALVHPREVFKPAILASAASVIVGHQHLTGDPAPSLQDANVTRKLVQAGRQLGIEVMDHIIVGGPGRYCSLASVRPDLWAAGLWVEGEAK